MDRPNPDYPVLVIGAGPAGLATAACLARRRIGHRLLERGASLGASWRATYDSLVLHTGRHMSTLPGGDFPKGTPLFPTRDQFIAYLEGYARDNALSVETGCDVVQLGAAALVDPTTCVQLLRQAGVERTALVIEIDTEVLAELARPERAGVAPHEAGPRFEFERSTLHHLLVANSVDATGEVPTWWVLQRAIELGAEPAGDGRGDVVLPDGSPAWLDGGPVQWRAPLDGVALRAAVIAHCAGPDRYYPFLDAMFANQTSWARAKDPVAALKQLARLGGLPEDKVDTCLADEAMSNAVLQDRLDGEKEFKVDSTPTLVINGTVYEGDRTLDGLAAVIDPLTQ